MAISLDEKLAGVLIPVFALRRNGDLKVGDTLAFMDAIDFCSRNRIQVLQTLPINETSGDNSPYNAISSMAVEAVLLSMEPEMVPGMELSWLEQGRQELKEAPCDYVDYALVKSVKHRLLKRAFQKVVTDKTLSASLKELKRFEKENAEWLHPYALFRALMDVNNMSPVWTEWVEEQRSYEAGKKWLENASNKAEVQELLEFYSFIQWVGDRQWRLVKQKADKANVRLMGDIPFGVSRYSADVWHNQELFNLELSGGAPPEPVFHTDKFTERWGQNWGIPLYHWDKHRKEDFLWWRKRISRLIDHFHDFRIDHVLGFFRIYAFPWTPDRNGQFLDLSDEEASALTGGLLPGFNPRDDESESNQKLNEKEGLEILKHISDAACDGYIVAEDLGLVVPPYVRPTIHKLNMAGFAIPIFERDGETGEFLPMEKLHPLSLASYATHDHQPIKSYYRSLVEWWHGEDGHEGWLEVKRLMRLLKRESNSAPVEFSDQLHKDFMKALLNSPCWLAVMMITDLLALDLRFNQPGLSGSQCWTVRLSSELSEFEKDSVFGNRIRGFRDLIEESGRAPRVVAGSL